MQNIKKLTLAALIAVASAGAMAQAGPGGGVGTGDGTGAAAGTSEGGGGTTGWLANSPSRSGNSRVTAIAPADGSNTERSVAMAGASSTATMGSGAAPGTVYMIPGAVQVQAGTSETVTGNSRTVITRYWANVPSGVERDADFQRWSRLR